MSRALSACLTNLTKRAVSSGKKRLLDDDMELMIVAPVWSLTPPGLHDPAPHDMVLTPQTKLRTKFLQSVTATTLGGLLSSEKAKRTLFHKQNIFTGVLVAILLQLSKIALTQKFGT